METIAVGRREAAKRLGIPYQTLTKKHDWLPPFFKAGRRVLYRISDIEEWIKERERETRQAA